MDLTFLDNAKEKTLTIIEAYTNVLTGKAKEEGLVRIAICSGTLEGHTRCTYFDDDGLISFCNHCSCPARMKVRTLKHGGCPIGKW